MTTARRALSSAERLDWLRLIRSENVGPATFWRLMSRCGSAAAALDAIPRLAKRGGMQRQIAICSRAAAEKEIAAADRLSARFVACGEADYPTLLAATDPPPPLVCVRGHGVLLTRPSVAIVGARNSSALGNRLAASIARELGEHAYVIVSGLARGIDTAAHKGSLDSGTIAVMAGGIDAIYPPENAELYDNIVEHGLVVSEQPIGTIAQARDFPRRNRLISGLSLGVVVVEASDRSGSLITAHLAAEQGREVFAVPGSPLDPRCHGTNRLIREGATLIENAQHVLEALAHVSPPRMEEPARPPSDKTPEPGVLSESDIEAAHRELQVLLGRSPVAVNELIRQCAAPSAALIAALLELELAGRIERHADGSVSLLD